MKKKSINSNKSFGILFFVVFFLYGIWPILSSNEIRIWSLSMGIIFLILGLLNSKLLTPFYNIWIKLGTLLGRIVSPIVMFLVYFVFITPLAVIIRLLGKDLLRTKFNKLPSYWIKREKNIGTMKKQF
tara:strand:+ start:645 stop:1028 length:384 start_codon:yes stop_codon:yes gene_type:complete